MINYLVPKAQASSQAHESGPMVKEEPALGTRAVPNRWAVTSPENHPTQKEAGHGGGRGEAGPRRMAGNVGAAPVGGERSSGAHSDMPAPIPAPVGATAWTPQRRGLEERRARKWGPPWPCHSADPWLRVCVPAAGLKPTQTRLRLEALRQRQGTYFL